MIHDLNFGVYVGETFEEFVNSFDYQIVGEKGVDFYLGHLLKIADEAYEEKKKKKEMKAKAKTSEVKEIRFTPNTDDHDFEFKVKHAEKFLKDGDKVKAHVQFKGRAIMFKERGEILLLKFADSLKDVGALESMPKMEGKRSRIRRSFCKSLPCCRTWNY